LVLAAVIPIAITAGCGGSSSSSAASTTTSAAATTAPASTAPAATAPTTTAPAKGGATVAVAADPSGALAYVQKTLTAPAGSDTFKFTNASPVPHNLAFEKAGTKNELGVTKTITSGSASVTLTLPKGTYAYYCSVPGHEAAGMKGTLTVK